MEKQRKNQLAAIVTPLLAWYGQNARALPWRRDREPYHVWVSEIMLQQTRVEAVRGYYERFLAALPDVRALADCPEERLMKLWEGLGYYRRARNLQKAAKTVMTEHGGVFPTDYASIRALAGIGDYTAGAIASICFGQPTPAVDGNVLRIMARLTNCHQQIDAPAVHRSFDEQLRAIYPPDAGTFIQALMELGACVCTPQSPKCALCPVCGACLGYDANTQTALPVRKAKKARRVEVRTVFLLRANESLALQKRPDGGLLGGMWELPAVSGERTAEEGLEQARRWGLDPVEMEKTLHHTHVFTHIEWHMTCHVIAVSHEAGVFTWVTPEALGASYALPSAFRPFLDAYALTAKQ